MAEVVVKTMVELRCHACGQWCRLHYDFWQCHCGGQMQHLTEWVHAEIPPDELEIGY